MSKPPSGPAVSSEVSAAIHRALLPGASPFARLGLPEAFCETKVLRRAYRTAALLIHPDKCSHPQAKMAFQKISEAFDRLSGGQKQELGVSHDEPTWRTKIPKGGYPGKPYQRGGRYDRPAPPGCWGESGSRSDDEDVRGGKSWWDAGFSEFEKRLRAREAEESRREAMEAALRRGEDSLDAYMSVLEAELSTPNDTSRGTKRQGPDRAGNPSDGNPGPTGKFSGTSGISAPGHQQNMPSFSMRKPFRGRQSTQAASSCSSAASTQMADVLLGHLDSDGSELSDWVQQKRIKEGLATKRSVPAVFLKGMFDGLKIQ